MELLIVFTDNEMKFYALNNVGSTALKKLLKYFVVKRTFTDEESKRTLTTSSDPEVALSEYLKFRPKVLRSFRMDIEGQRTVYAEVFDFGNIRDKIVVDRLDNSALQGILQNAPDFPTCLASCRKRLECKQRCTAKCCTECEHKCRTCENESCASFNCCLDNTSSDCNHECSSCKLTLTKCKERYVVCCDRCMLCMNCKEKTAAELCLSEQLRGFADTIFKSRLFAFQIRGSQTELDANTYQSEDFPDCSNWDYLWQHVRRSVEGVLDYLLSVKQISQIEYEDEMDRVFEIDVNERRQLVSDQFVEILDELEALHVYRTIRTHFWHHIAQLRERRHYMTLIARKKNWLTHKYEDWATRDVGLFGNVATKVYKQVKKIFEETLGKEHYKVFPIRCSFKDLYSHPTCNTSVDVLIAIRPADGEEELPEYLSNVQSNEARELWKSISDGMESRVSDQLHVEASQILTRWDHNSARVLYLQTVMTRETGGEFSPWEEVIAMNIMREELIRGFSTTNVTVKKLPLVQIRRDSVKLQFEIDTKNEKMFDHVNHMLHHAKDYDFLKM